MILPVKREIRPFRKVYGADLAAVILFAMLLVGIAAVTTASRLHVPVSAGLIGRTALYHLAIPFLVWMTLISFLTVVQHTHPQARWRISDGQPSSVGDQADGTIHVVFPEWLDLIFHRVMHHHAHHLQPAIPVYHLKYAQHHLSKVAEGAAIPFVVARWSFRSHFDMAARCKLFDIENDCWRDFGGRVTGRPLAVSTP